MLVPVYPPIAFVAVRGPISVSPDDYDVWAFQQQPLLAEYSSRVRQAFCSPASYCSAWLVAYLPVLLLVPFVQHWQPELFSSPPKTVNHVSVATV